MTSFQILSCRIQLEYDDAELARVFRYVIGRSRQDAVVHKTFHYAVRGGGPFEIREEGDVVDTVGTADEVLFIIYARAHRRAIERFVLSGWVLLHGAVAEIHRRRILILGHKGAGKSTLAARLLWSGHLVEGDELALERNGQVVALPRLLHLKPGVERHVPELGTVLADLPRLLLGEAQMTALDPSSLGHEWVIAARPIDDLVWIAPNHGGATAVQRRAPFAAIQRILAAAPGFGESRQALVASASRLGRSGGHELTLGDPHEGVACLERLAAAR